MKDSNYPKAKRSEKSGTKRSAKQTALRLFSIVLFLSYFTFGYAKSPDTFNASTLKCEYMINPLGIDVQTPRLSWVGEMHQRGAIQTAYRILVASSKKNLDAGKGDLWDSKEINSDQSLNIVYAGKPLLSGMQCYWKVKVWDKDGKESAWSTPALWSMGLLAESDWHAKWIGLDKGVGKDEPNSEFRRLSARMLRKEFEVKGNIRRATAYICGLGLFELHSNGKKIGDQVLSPALSEYAKRSYYITFDMTSQLHKGKNAIGVILGNGRFFGLRLNALTVPNAFPKMLFQLELEMEDGSKQTILSDETWKLTTDGPIIANNEYDGEEYDATKEINGWDQPGFDDKKWMTPELVKNPSAVLRAPMTEPIKVKELVQPKFIKELTPGVFIMDMGQNMVGWLSMNVMGKKGETVSLRFAETLNPDGSLYVANLRTAKVTDKYTLKGEGTESFEPRFTYHGFRFVEIKGYPGKPELKDFTGKVVYDDMETTGSFETSNGTINAIYKNAYWGIRGNYRSIPTDCPQRDERHGWLGDRAAGSKGEGYIFDNSKLYAKWLQDIEDSQLESGTLPGVAPTYWKVYNDDVSWPGAYVLIADMLYEQYGDLEPMKKHYNSMKKWVDYMKTNYLKDGILIKDTYGDWCMPPETPELIHSTLPGRKTKGELISTAYFYDILTIMNRYAKMFHKEEDASAFAKTSAVIYKAYNDTFFDKEKKCYSNNTATANLLSLAFKLVPTEDRQAVFNQIVKKTLGEFRGHTSTGIVGAQWINRMFSEFNRPDIAYLLSTNTDYPSLGYMLKHDATTIWELWNGNTAEPSMNSGNHVMLLGDLIIWYYESLAGIKVDSEHPGFKHFIMKPDVIKELTFAKGSYNTVYGTISSSWKIDNNQYSWDITVPANCSATVYVPALAETDVEESGIPATKAEGVKFVRLENNRAIFEVTSGTYKFVSKQFKFQNPEMPTVATPMISPVDTLSATPVLVKISCSTPGAEIRYTMDGSEPNENSPIYIAPFTLDKPTVILTSAFKKGLLPAYSTSSDIEIYNADLNGYNYSLYLGEWTKIPDFSKLTPKASGKSIDLDVSKIANRAEDFCLKLETFVTIEQSGDYTFFITSDDGSKLTIDGKLLIDNDGIHGMDEKSERISLSKGKHALVLEYLQGKAGAGLSFEYVGPGMSRRKLPVSALLLK